MSDLAQVATAIQRNINSVVLGKNESIILTLVTFLCGGHLLIEDAPGLGKTLLADEINRAIPRRSAITSPCPAARPLIRSRAGSARLPGEQ